MPVVAVFIAREMQDFVSFHGWCHHCFNVKTGVIGNYNVLVSF